MTRGRRCPVRAALLIVALLVAPAAAVRVDATGVAAGPMTWVQSSFEDFSAGELLSVSLDAEGEVRLAPRLERLGDLPEPYVWAVDGRPDGTVFAAAGTEGRVYRLDRGGADAEVFFEVEGTVHALTVGHDDHVYVAASPGGDVWRLPPDGAPEDAAPWASTGARYVWSLLVAEDGTAYAGTGDGGVIHRIAPDGAATVLYDSSEEHVTALAFDGDGNLLAGTSDGGHLYRIAPDGDVFVLFDAPVKQVTGIVATPDGVYFAGFEQGAADDGEDGGEGGGAAISGSGGEELRGAVYRLHEDGFIEQLWGSGEQAAHAIGAAADGGVVVGTGERGRLLHVGPEPAAALLADADAAQITALRARGDAVLVGTSNLGRVYRLERAYRDRGELVSQVKDTATVSRWGRLRWRGSTPGDASIRFFTRSGNTETPDDTWSGWSDAYEDAGGSPISSPSARFVQWKAELQRDPGGATPVLQWVELVYVQRNLRPDVSSFTVHPAGVIYRQNTSFEDSLPIGRLPSPVREALAAQQGRNGAPSSGSSSFLGQAYYLPGSQTFTWEAADANGDRMSYMLLYRGEAESTWKPIAGDLAETQYLWDTTTVPDGLYRARVVASDAPSNPRGEELAGTRTSQPLIVDNTPPRVDNLSARVEGGRAWVTGTASDATSLIRAIEFAVDGGEWEAVLPADGLPDAGDEELGFSTMRLEPGEHTIVVRITDTALNSGTAKVVVTVE